MSREAEGIVEHYERGKQHATLKLEGQDELTYPSDELFGTPEVGQYVWIERNQPNMRFEVHHLRKGERP